MRGVVLLLLFTLLAGGCMEAAETRPAPAAKPIVETTGALQVDTVETGGEPMGQMTRERVSLTAQDGTTLVATYYESESAKGILLLHQLGRDRSSWESLAGELQRGGFSLLAIDLRGHGESAGDWNTFGDEDFVKMLQDAKAGATFLKGKEKRVLAVIGASIGANTAFRYSSTEKVPAILLSPGLEYKGIDIDSITSTARTLIIVAEEDTYASRSSLELEENNLFGEHRLLVIPGGAHGTDMLSSEEALAAIRAFLNE